MLTSERLLPNVLNTITYIKSKVEDKVNMEGFAGKNSSIICLFFLFVFSLFDKSVNCMDCQIFFLLFSICLKQYLSFIFIRQVVCLYILFGYLEM